MPFGPCACDKPLKLACGGILPSWMTLFYASERSLSMVIFA